jgi:hypothetical protein
MKTYSNIVRPSLDGIPRTMLLVVPSDTQELPRTAKGLRILNNSAVFETIRIVTEMGDTVTLDVPPQTLLYEDVLVAQVLETGTTVAQLIIHAYLD